VSAQLELPSPPLPLSCLRLTSLTAFASAAAFASEAAFFSAWAWALACKAYYLPLDNGGYPFELVSMNYQVITAHRHPPAGPQDQEPHLRYVRQGQDLDGGASPEES
jgi:hypothetical protein